MRHARWLVLLIAVLSAGCGLLLTREFDDPSQPIDVQRGDEFLIHLKSNATTGYRWELAKPVDETIITLVNHEYRGSVLPIAGAGGEEQWTFRAVGAGTTQIDWIYRREHQPGNVAPTTFNVSVQ
ncbi:MAG: protease inhibitor I42 family protein [Chloroflexi bacterium]|nr:protease inhibitor I42 family protein [Chloroflexota bacterium]